MACFVATLSVEVDVGSEVEEGVLDDAEDSDMEEEEEETGEATGSSLVVEADNAFALN